ncbi:MAG TPA: CHAT domain-containing protein [Acidobacteriaceae bacterium]|nr:CHAT domain-containing protein [Acidobacteriaceae bacterium]
MIWRGYYDDALNILSASTLVIRDPKDVIEQTTLRGVALAGMQQFAEASLQLRDAERLCRNVDADVCGSVSRANGVLALKRGAFDEARRQFIASQGFAQAHGDRWLEATALLNLGTASLQEEHYDEALNWSRAAYNVALKLEAEDLVQSILGNQGWAYYRLGDTHKALAFFSEAQAQAGRLGDVETRISWLTTEGDVYADSGQISSAENSYRQALDLASHIKSKEAIIDAAMDLAEVYVEVGRLDDADRYAKEALQLSQKSGNRLDILYSHLIQGQVALRRRDWVRASALLREVEGAPESQTSMKWASELAMARLYEAQGQVEAAGKEYQTALGTFEGARAELKSADSQLPFVANATRIYDDYIHFLVGQGKIDEALMAADQSRARTLLQGLGIAAGQPGERQAGVGPDGAGVVRVDLRVTPTAVARKAQATLLFYWLGEKQSYLWVVTPGMGSPGATKLFSLPAKAEIERRIGRYREALLGPEDPLAAGNEDGRALYATLIGPAAGLIDKRLPVMVLADGALCQLNFATLIAPAIGKTPEHYWIEDATVISAPSLAMLAAGKPAKTAKGGRLLLVGDAISPDANYPQLAYASTEMQEIEKHFAAGERTVYAREQAAPEAYLRSNLSQYAYIHFVSHGVASQTDPLDSAIILSKGGLPKGGAALAGIAKDVALQAGMLRGEDSPDGPLRDGSASQDAGGDAGRQGEDQSFKLYAREIMQHPIDARLVTISACYGNGTRVYVGEGLVGLSWAFLHAGAHNAIGALWEASDRSTAILMDALYKGLAAGEAPGVALRNAQLELLHAKTNFHKPFYWAPFQIYTRM